MTFAKGPRGAAFVVPSLPGWRALCVPRETGAGSLRPIVGWACVPSPGSSFTFFARDGETRLVPVGEDGEPLAPGARLVDGSFVVRLGPPELSDEAVLIDAWLAYAVEVPGWERDAETTASKRGRLAELGAR